MTTLQISTIEPTTEGVTTIEVTIGPSTSTELVTSTHDPTSTTLSDFTSLSTEASRTTVELSTTQVDPTTIMSPQNDIPPTVTFLWSRKCDCSPIDTTNIPCPYGNVCSAPKSSCRYITCDDPSTQQLLLSSSSSDEELVEASFLTCIAGSWSQNGVIYRSATCVKSCNTCDNIVYDTALCPSDDYLCETSSSSLVYTQTTNGCTRVQCSNPNTQMYDSNGRLSSQPVCTGTDFSTPEVTTVQRVVCARRCSCSSTRYNPVVPVGINAIEMRREKSARCFSRFSGCPDGYSLRIQTIEGSIIFFDSKEANSKILECMDGTSFRTIFGNTTVNIDNYTCFKGGCSSCTFSTNSSQITASTTYDNSNYCKYLTLFGCQHGYRISGSSQLLTSSLMCDVNSKWQIGSNHHVDEHLDISCL